MNADSHNRIVIADRVYLRNPTGSSFRIPIDELGGLTMREVPPHSHLEVVGIPVPQDAAEAEIYALNPGDEGEVSDQLCVYGGLSYHVEDEDRPRILRALRRAFPDQTEDGYRSMPEVYADVIRGVKVAGVYFSVNFNEAPDTRIVDAVAPFIEGFRRMCRPSVHAFICHASEDKPVAREIAARIRALGSEVWFDEWEIRVGDSITMKINEALGEVTHLIVLLSAASVTKPWVQKELSSAMMRQLSQNAVTVLPVRLDDCAIPPLLADVRYVTTEVGIDALVKELERSMFEM